MGRLLCVGVGALLLAVAGCGAAEGGEAIETASDALSLKKHGGPGGSIRYTTEGEYYFKVATRSGSWMDAIKFLFRLDDGRDATDNWLDGEGGEEAWHCSHLSQCGWRL